MAINFKVGAGQSAFTVETRTGAYVPSYPLEAREPTALMVRAPYMQTLADYSRPVPYATLTYAGVTLCFVDDSDFQDVRGGVVTWVRTWASIPTRWSDPEEYVYSFPAFTATAVGSTFSVTAITAGTNSFVLSTSMTGVVVGDSVFINVSFTRNGIAGYRYATTVKATAVSSGVSVTIPAVFAGYGSFTSVTGTVQKLGTGRSAVKTIAVASRVVYEYAFSAEATIDVDLPILQPWVPINATTGLEVDSLTTGTSPTAAEYRAMINANELLVVSSSIRRYMGNIYVRATRYVLAQ